MTTDLVPDELWEAIGPPLPRHRPNLKGRRPRIPDRAVLGGLIHVLCTGVPWRCAQAVPARPAAGLREPDNLLAAARDWQQAGVWERLHHRLLDWLGDDGQLDWAAPALPARC